MADTPSDAERRAKAILAGLSATPEDVIALTKKLHSERRFGLARKLLQRVIRYREVNADPQMRLRVGQKLALSTYKDPDLSDGKLELALEILRNVEDLAATVNQETLGLAGAIHKRMWERDGRERHLENAYAFYLRGYRQGVSSDFGYTAINAAFVAQLLDDLEVPDAEGGSQAGRGGEERNRQIAQIRQAIVDELPPLLEAPRNAYLKNEWWFFATLGEAYFGLRNCPASNEWLGRAAALTGVPDWERESTARQLAALMRLMERQDRRQGRPIDPAPREILRRFLRDAEPALQSVERGRIGLALSGGGFRASLYHVGVLARLAELDLLRQVEYLSCVSGGSIVGAHYYLEVRKLLASKPDAAITAEDYVQIVERLQRELLAGIQRNIRTRIAAEWLTNLRMIFQPDYSRTMRAGELYEEEIFSRVPDGEGDKPRWLNELKIQPLGEIADFRPKDHNWRRAAKVPILILNATSLNTGHNWQFTAAWMGEPPAGTDSQVDASYRLRRVYYEDAPKPNDRIRLGYAVAASACVPGIFEPLSIVNLYERLDDDGDHKVRPIVRLVDGGVHDNQGTSALLDQGCSVLLVSDASGQMDHADSPSTGLLGVPLRANSILQARVRLSQYEDLESRRRGGTLRGLMFVHLKQDLESQPVDWIGCQDPVEKIPASVLTSYGIQKSIQRRLAMIRTDLDSFSDVEAYGLMTSGYLATAASLKRPILGFDVGDATRRAWPFLRISPVLEQPGATTPLVHWFDRQLRVGNTLAFKVWQLVRWLQVVAGLALAAVLVTGAVMWRELSEIRIFQIPPTVGNVLMDILWIALALSGFGLVSKLVNYRKTLREVLLGIGMATIGFIFARLHLYVFDRLFLLQGKLPRVLAQTQTAAVAERMRGLEERKVSLEKAASSEEKLGYAVQQSEGFVLFAKKNLDPTTETRVTQAIFKLSDNPHPEEANSNPGNGLKLLRVSGTPWRIAYEVDDEQRRIRIHHLVNALEQPGRGAP